MRMTLSEVLKTCSNWDKFCEMKETWERAVSEGGGHLEFELTLKEALELGIIKRIN